MRKLRAVIAICLALGLAGMAAITVYKFLDKPQVSNIEQFTVRVENPRAPSKPPLTFSQSIPKGMRAVTIVVEAVEGGAEVVVVGDRVDILAVTPINVPSEGHVSRLLLSGVEVVKVDKGVEQSGRRARKTPVTLLVSLADAATLSAVAQVATLRLVLRNPGDENIAVTDDQAFVSIDGLSTYKRQERDLASLIHPGMRAVTLQVGPTDGVGGVFRPDDRVDIVVTCPWGNVSLKSRDQPGEQAVLKETHRNSRILLQNIRIIATDRSLSWDNSYNYVSQRVTLEVSPEDAEKLTVLADSKSGKNIIRLLSRNRDDHALAETSGVELLDLLSERRPYMRVDMIRGPLRKDQIFYK